MIKSIVREHHWAFFIIDRMYIDAQDHRGIEYWYNDVMEVSNEMKSKK